MSKTVILSAARTPIGKLGGGLSSLEATELGGIAIKAALERAEVEPEQVEHVVMGTGAPGRPGPDPLAPGPDQGRHPEGGLLRDDQQGLRLGHPRRRACIDAAIRAGDLEVGVGGGMESMSQRALPAAQGPLRLPHGRRQGARRDDPRRPAQPVHRQADVRGGHRGRRRARDDPRRTSTSWALRTPRARARGAPTTAACPRRSSP